jgi:hypothetical protein
MDIPCDVVVGCGDAGEFVGLRPHRKTSVTDRPNNVTPL